MGSCCKCHKKRSHLCPFSFGLALGITSALAVLIWGAWMMYHGAPPAVIERMGPLDWSNISIHALWTLLKGFVFGLVLALLYDLFACMCKSMCCRKSKLEAGSCGCDSGCNCGCACHRKGVDERRKDVM